MFMSFVPYVNKFTFYQEENQIDSILLHSSLLLEALFPNLGLKSHSEQILLIKNMYFLSSHHHHTQCIPVIL